MEAQDRRPDVGEVFEEHGPRMLNVAQRILRNEEDAADAVQEAMLALMKTPYVLTNLQAVGAWLYTLVRRRCVDIVRGDRRRARAEEETTRADLVADRLPDEVVGQRELVERAARAVKNLPADLRFAFVEHAVHDKTFKVVSEESGIPMGTLMARKKKAVEILRDQLAGT